MAAAADAASEVRARVVRICVRSLRKVSCSWASGPIRAWSGPRLIPARALWVDEASEASCCRAATRSGPAVCGRRSRAWDRPTAPMPTWATCWAAPDRSWTDRSWRPATGRHVDGPEQRRREQAVRTVEVRLGRAEGPDGRSGQDAVRREALAGRLHRRLAMADVLGGHHQVDDSGGRPDHDERDDGGGDLPPSGEPPPPRRLALLGPLGEVGARVPGLAALHRGERTAVKSASHCHPGPDLREI